MKIMLGALALTVVTVIFSLSVEATIRSFIADPARVGDPYDMEVDLDTMPHAEAQRLRENAALGQSNQAGYASLTAGAPGVGPGWPRGDRRRPDGCR